MNYQDYLELKSKRAAKLKEGEALLEKKDFESHKTLMAEVKSMNEELDAAEAQFAEEGRFEDGDAGMVLRNKAFQAQQEDRRKSRSVDEIRSTNEYANAFAKALRNGVKVGKVWGVEGYEPLQKALTETGGSPEGADGGFLVPQDFDNMIHTLEKEYLDLAQFFTMESVRSLTGWRAVEDGKRKTLPKIAEMGKMNPNDQPKFTKVTYTVEKYGDRLPISSELLTDNAAGLLRYLADWFGPKYILTKNTLLLELLKGLETEVALTKGSEAKELRKALITKLNTAHSMAATLLTNQSGYAEMDGWEDKNGRSLLVPNPADPDVYRFGGRRVVYGDNDLIPDETTKRPIYVGNLKALGTLFVRKGIEMAATDVGGDAWATDSYEIRGLCRMDAVTMDKTAGFKATIATAGG